MQLTLPIGMPKTGVTALQSALTAVRPALSERGVLFLKPKTCFSSHNFLWLQTVSHLLPINRLHANRVRYCAIAT